MKNAKLTMPAVIGEKNAKEVSKIILTLMEIYSFQCNSAPICPEHSQYKECVNPCQELCAGEDQIKADCNDKQCSEGNSY